MKRIKILTTFLVIAVVGLHVEAQGDYMQTKIIPSSPNASTLGEYGNTPVSLTTGTPDISIPIWEIKGSKLSLPISVSYRASGIKTEDQGSSIGIGWALNAGGVITRSIKGKPENGINQYTGKIAPSRPQNLPYDMTPNTLTYSEILAITDEAGNPVSDSEPDLFYYNFGNYSGKFVFDENGVPQIMPNTQFKLDYTGTEAEFVITDLEGTKYYFDDVETLGVYNTSWYLSKIVSVNGLEEISFEYVPESFTYWMPDRRIAYVNASLTVEENINAVAFNQRALRVKKINTNFGVSIDFLEGVDREDYNIITSANKPKTINDIVIKYNNQCIKKFVFDNEFVETDKPFDSTHYLWNYYDMSWANKRMYLKRITETSCNNSVSKKYSFDYWGRLSNGKDSLVNKMSYAQDHWGYYNGKTTNTSLRPAFSGQVPHPDVNNSTLTFKSVPGADRSSQFPWMRCGTLKSIIYPTGGKTFFEYEANYADHDISGYITAGGLRISKVIDSDASGNILKTKRYEYNGGWLVSYPDYTNGNRVFRFNKFNEELYDSYYLDGIYPVCAACDQHQSRKLMIHSGPVNGLGSTNGYHLNYREVKEIEEGNGYVLNIYNCAKESWGSLGDYIDSYYTLEPVPENNPFQKYGVKGITTAETYGGSWQYRGGWPYAPSTDYSWKRGLLFEQHFYQEGNSVPIKSVLNGYSYYNLSPVYGMVWRNVHWGFYGEDGSHQTGKVFFYGNYKVQYGVAKLTEQTITENGVSRIINSEYNEHHMLSKTTETSSEGKTIETKTFYPDNIKTESTYQDDSIINGGALSASEFSAIDKMKQDDLHQTATPIQVETIVKDANNNILAQSILRNSYYEPFTNLVLPKEVKSLKGIYNASNNILQNRIIFDDYYSNGNIKEVSKKDGTHIVYIWGYNEGFPIAKIENALYSQVSGQVANLQSKANSDNDRTIDLRDSNGNISSYEGNEGSLRQALNNLRASLPGAMVTTYTYDPLIGVTSTTDPKGYTVYYEYDDFNRLKQVRDADGKILGENRYHYKGQQ